MQPQILYEDEHVLVINKPAGMVVNAAQTVKDETVQDWVEENGHWLMANDRENRNGIVHRIDKETSGVLLIAKTLQAFQELQRQFKSREVEKTYLALVHGKVEPPEGEIRAPLGRLPWNRERFGVLAGGRDAVTKYHVSSIKYHVSGKEKELLSLVEFYPRTGRTHQIRVHAKSIGHPIVGDAFYAGRKTSRADRAWCPRLFLHASRIVFKHPKTGERKIIDAPLPEELEKVLSIDILKE